MGIALRGVNVDIDDVMTSDDDALTDTVSTCIERELDDHSVANRERQIADGDADIDANAISLDNNLGAHSVFDVYCVIAPPLVMLNLRGECSILLLVDINGVMTSATDGYCAHVHQSRTW